MTDSNLHTPASPPSAHSIYEKFLPELEKLERRRTAHVHFLFGIVGGSIALSFLWWLIAAPPEASLTGYVFVTLMVMSLPAYFCTRSFMRGYWLNAKPVSHSILKFVLGEKYRPHGTIPLETILDHHIVPLNRSRVYMEDGFKMIVRGQAVTFQEIDAVKSLDEASVRENMEYTIKKGLYIHMHTHADLQSHTVLVTKQFFDRRFTPALGFDPKKYKDVGLVSPRFSKQFAVYSTDQVEARVAFNPAFIEKFLDIASRLKAVQMDASFLHDELLIFAGYKRDLFQLGSFWKPVYEEDIHFLMSELTVFGDLIEIIKPNPYTNP